ncbi:uridine kinase [Nonomuraea soli]|uniref:Uridine kinase n=1 Tax=Nonomuraea soli TaxID=1032476 RepID=A0A7W0CLJ0_9ACTN|nr:uridine kinase [Nonomuraea soli]MBA2893404.1 hypothetical protein [Nonomuraea soli]
MRARAISPEHLIEELAERIVSGGARRVAIDGAPGAEPGRLADALVEPLKAAGRAPVRVSAGDFLRPASLRLEYGRTDPDEFYDSWLDARALSREVLDRRGSVLTKLWNAGTDRAYRVPYTPVPESGVVLVDGTLLLGRGLAFDLTVHLWLSRAALRRKTEEALQWRLPAYERYEREISPLKASDIAVKVDDPRHPAIIEG